MKPHLPRILLKFEPAEYRQFIHRQFRAMRIGLWSIFRDKTWIDNPWNIEAAENKPYQLFTAGLVGLYVPDTIITSNPEAVLKFYH
ncbi:MAG TPA: hypothetical protein PLF70_01680 [Candidatus Portnoybacteria bacterium]|nr:hypothetical protein [Candidatus Portnoybacteria bacterium]